MTPHCCRVLQDLDCTHITEDNCDGNEGAGVLCSGKMSYSSLLFDDKICSNEYDFLNSLDRGDVAPNPIFHHKFEIS